jgi:hypothetical protein
MFQFISLVQTNGLPAESKQLKHVFLLCGYGSYNVVTLTTCEI